MFWKCSFWVFYYPWFSSVQYITLASFSAMVDLERQDQDQDQAEHVFLESCDSPTWQWLTNLPTMYFLHVGQQFTWKRAFVTDVVFLWLTDSYLSIRQLRRAEKVKARPPSSPGCETRPAHVDGELFWFRVEHSQMFGNSNLDMLN